jgi:histidine ammonia-lyase
MLATKAGSRGGCVTVVVDTRRDFTLEAFRRVGVDGEDVIIGPRALRLMGEARAGFEDLLRANRTGFIYGVTTRPGVEVGTTIPPEEQRDYALGFRGVGRGFGRDHLDERVVRGIVFARLADFVGGHGKVRPELAQRVAAMLTGPLPRVPLDGQGGAGEILPLMHVMASVDGDLVEGEGMALLNGSPCATALLADVALHAGNRLALAEAIFALSVEGYRAPLDAYDQALDDLWGDEAERAVLRHLRGHLGGAGTSGRLGHQAPVSYRILPQVLGQAQRAVRAVVRAATAALGSVTENPVYVPADEHHPSGRVLSNGGFHNGAAAPALDWLTAAWADLALVAQRQVIAMHSPTSGLPHLLSPPGFVGGASGGATNLFGWVASGLVEEARALAAPTLLPATINDTQNDIASPAFGAYRSQRRAAECLDSVLAILAVVSSQALFVTGRDPAPPLAGLLDGIRHVFPPLETDRADQGTQAGDLAGILSRAALTGELEFPGRPVEVGSSASR